MDTRILLVIAGAVLLHGWVSRRLDRLWITPPLAFIAIGIIFGPSGFVLCQLSADAPLIDFIAEITLILILFSDASRISLRRLRREFSTPLRLLGIGLPLTIALGTLLARGLFPEFGWAECALLAAILAPTDAALGQAVVSSPKVPLSTRQTLNVESGLNDGIALPAVLFFAAFAGLAEGEGEGSWTTFVATQLTLGPLIGVLVGGLGAWVTNDLARREAIDRHFVVYTNLALALIAYGAAHELGGNGFIAAFIAGMVAGNIEEDQCGCLVEFTEEEGQLLMLLTFLFFGASIVVPAFERASLATFLYAAASLTVIRMIPVAISLVGTSFRAPTVLFLGWFGPRGLASILFGLAVLEAAHGNERASQIFDVVVVTVTASAVLHGFSATPLAARYGVLADRWQKEGEHPPELAGAPDLPIPGAREQA